MAKSGKNPKQDSAKVDLSKVDTKVDKTDPSGKGDQATSGEEFLRDQVGGSGADDRGLSTGEQIQDQFGQEPAGNEPSVDDLLNPDMPTRGEGSDSSGGPATWQDGPSDPSVGTSDGVSVADGYFSNVAAGVEAVAKGAGMAYDAVAGDEPGAEPMGPVEGPGSEPMGPVEEPGSEPIGPIDETELEEFLEGGSGKMVWTAPDGGLMDPYERQTMAPGAAEGALGRVAVPESTENLIVRDDSGDEHEVAVNGQSSEELVSYSFDEDGEYWATDSSGTSFPIDAKDVPPNTYVQDRSGAFEGEGDYITPGEKADSTGGDTTGGDTTGGDTTGGDTTGGDTTEGDTTEDDTTEDDTTEDDTTEDDTTEDDGGDPEGSETPDYETWEDPAVARIREAGRQVEAEAGQESDGSDAWARVNKAGNDVDPVEHESVDTTGGSQVDSDSGISNPEGAENTGGGRTTSPGRRNEPDYGQDSDVSYDGVQRSAAEELPSVDPTLDSSLLLEEQADEQSNVIDVDDLRTGLVEFDDSDPTVPAEDSDDLDPFVLDEVKKPQPKDSESDKKSESKDPESDKKSELKDSESDKKSELKDPEPDKKPEPKDPDPDKGSAESSETASESEDVGFGSGDVDDSYNSAEDQDVVFDVVQGLEPRQNNDGTVADSDNEDTEVHGEDSDNEDTEVHGEEPDVDWGQFLGTAASDSDVSGLVLIDGSESLSDSIVDDAILDS